jgi:hypothetical protein
MRRERCSGSRACAPARLRHGDATSARANRRLADPSAGAIEFAPERIGTRGKLRHGDSRFSVALPFE